LKIINHGLDVLKENMFVGERIERRKFPRYYVQKFGINNLYKLNLDLRTRLIYTLVAEETGSLLLFWRFWIIRSMRKDLVMRRLRLSEFDACFY